MLVLYMPKRKPEINEFPELFRLIARSEAIDASDLSPMVIAIRTNDRIHRVRGVILTQGSAGDRALRCNFLFA